MALILDGRDPGSQMALHTCDNPICVRPSHLYVGTGKQNMQDRSARNRASYPTGERNHAAVLTDAQRAEVRDRRASGETLRAIAADYGVTHRTIFKVCR